MRKVGKERWSRGIFNFWYNCTLKVFELAKTWMYVHTYFIFYALHPFKSSIFPVLLARKFSWNVCYGAKHEIAWSARNVNFTVDHTILVHSHNIKLKCAILAFKSLSIILASEDFLYGCHIHTRNSLEIRSLHDTANNLIYRW